MADQTFPVASGVLKKLKDMGDGTFAEVVTVSGLTVTADTINLDTSDIEAKLGIITETAPANDTASSGLNGRLQRVAQRLTTLIAGLPIFGGDGATVASATNALPVSDAARVFSVLGTVLTRPGNVTPYSGGDSISDNATAGSVTPLPVTVSDVNDAPVTLTEIELDTNDTGLAAGVQVDVFVYNSDPTTNTGVGGGDNAAFSNKRAGFRARFRGTFIAFSDGGKCACVPVDGANNNLPAVNIAPESGGKRLWYQVKAITGFTSSANGTTITPRFKGFQGRA